MTQITVVADRRDWPHLLRLIDPICTDYEAREFYTSESKVPVRFDIDSDDVTPEVTAKLFEIEKSYISVVKKKSPLIQQEEPT